MQGTEPVWDFWNPKVPTAADVVPLLLAIGNDELGMDQYLLINTIFRGMNIHKSQLFWCELQGYYWFWHTNWARTKSTPFTSGIHGSMRCACPHHCFFFFSPVFDGQWLGKMMIHWYPLDFWVIFRQNQVSHWIQIGWSRLDEEKGSQPVFYAYPLGDDMKGILNCNIRWFGNRCQQCLMFVFFNLSWVSWRRTSSTKNPLRLHKSSLSSR